MRRIPVLIVAAGLAASAVGAQTPSDSAASKSALLTLDQKTKISEMITERTPPLEGGSFPVSVDGVVPSDVQLNSLPSEAEQLAPQLRGFSYVVVEELVATGHAAKVPLDQGNGNWDPPPVTAPTTQH